MVSNLPANAGDTRDMGSVPESRRSLGVGNGNPLQYSCLENPMDYIACQAPLSMEFSRQEYWSGLPFPTPRDRSDAGIELASLNVSWISRQVFTTSAN